ncbi:hypothetical protein J7L01_03655, partial [bacterium]|nr:hypothetical protein [bacterium]
LLTVAENALSYWATVALEPLFAPVVGDFTALQTLYDDCIAARDVYVATEDQREATQNSVLATREALHVIERQVFNWYRSRYPDGQDERWTNTPWGCTGGSSGEPEEPEAPENWDDPPTGFTLKEGPPGFAQISAILGEGADGAALYVAEGPEGDDAQPFMPPEPAEPQVPLAYLQPINEGVRTWIWICAVKDGVRGNVAGPVWIERTL